MSKDPDPVLEWAPAMSLSLHPGPKLIRLDWEYDAEYKTTLAVCFDEAAGRSADELYDTLLEIGDRDDAETSFRERLGPVRLKAPFSGMTGMELRAHVRRNSNIAF